VNESAAKSLRSLQKDHALILLHEQELETLRAQGALAMPERHREHFVKVMRRAGAWQALVSDGRGDLCTVTVEKSVMHIHSATQPAPPAHARATVTLVQAWIKPKPLALILQKAAEFGVTHIQLIETERSQAAHEKPARLDAIVENACMQAYNPFKPRISTGSFDDNLQHSERIMAFGDLDAHGTLTDFLPAKMQHRGFFNGPEGGFSRAEVEKLRESAQGVLLSENVLRSETAAIFALGYLCLRP
jgi:16S rRNA (uracil1498-N3)-methyltransferase